MPRLISSIDGTRCVTYDELYCNVVSHARPAVPIVKPNSARTRGPSLGNVLLAIVAAVGWFRDVLPHEAHESIEVEEEFVTLLTPSEKVAHIEVDETHRAQLPLETFPISSGIKGGIAGGIAMVIPAELYGIIRFHSIWYVVNLLGGAGVGAGTARLPGQRRVRHLRRPPRERLPARVADLAVLLIAATRGPGPAPVSRGAAGAGAGGRRGRRGCRWR